MRRDIRPRKNQGAELNEKIVKYTGVGIAVLAVVVFALLIYSKNLNEEVKQGTLTGQQIASIIGNNIENENTESASTEIGKSVNEASSQLQNNTSEIVNNVVSNTNLNNNKNVQSNTSKNATNTPETNSKVLETEDKVEETQPVELNFEMPVEGEIVRQFAIDNLIYSDTLQEWTTHNGIDIKADKTTVVKSAEAGTIKTIKNDPRYGLTIIIEHENGFQTVYSNLLTSEFVVEGEKVQKGQSLGTVGNTAAFEIADEPHLHFEVIKDLIQVDPTIYIK